MCYCNLKRLVLQIWQSRPTLSASVGVFGLLFALLLADRVLTSAILSKHALILSDLSAMFCETAAISLAGVIPLWLFGRHSLFFYALVVPLQVILICVEWFVREHFRMRLIGSWVGVVFASSPEELREFLGEYASFTFCVCLFVLVVIIACLVKLLGFIVRRTSVSWKSAAAALLGLVMLLVVFFGGGISRSVRF